MSFIAAIEAGGTSIKLGIAHYDDPTKLLYRVQIPTTTPEETLKQIVDWLKSKIDSENIKRYEAIGVACFGPVDLQEGSETYGFITTTPKLAWQQCDFLKPLRCFDTPLGFDTDVNGAALGESAWGGHEIENNGSVAYITVGTGVGVGVVVGGNAVHGMLHPEGGHIPVPKHDEETLERGVCPFHPNCVEGYICTGALSKRVNRPASELALVSDDALVWRLCAYYLANLCASITLLCSPEVIVIGGGVVVNRPIIIEKVITLTQSILNGYLQTPKLHDENISQFIALSKHGDDAGLVGALELARRARTSRP